MVEPIATTSSTEKHVLNHLIKEGNQPQRKQIGEPEKDPKEVMDKKRITPIEDAEVYAKDYTIEHISDDTFGGDYAKE
ncbi:MAG TPA: hypothetical protein VN207_06760 [Ktedonobacteraceae bacterium]|nr:hypothetical protein [Ktedonobacteraceae bacterium]